MKATSKGLKGRDQKLRRPTKRPLLLTKAACASLLLCVWARKGESERESKSLEETGRGREGEGRGESGEDSSLIKANLIFEGPEGGSAPDESKHRVYLQLCFHHLSSLPPSTSPATCSPYSVFPL